MLTYNLRDWHFVAVPPGTRFPELKAGKVVVVSLLSDFLLSGRSASDGITGHRRAWVKEDSFFCFLTKAKVIDSFYAGMDFGSSPPLWTLDPRLVIAGGRWASVEKGLVLIQFLFGVRVF